MADYSTYGEVEQPHHAPQKVGGKRALAVYTQA